MKVDKLISQSAQVSIIDNTLSVAGSSCPELVKKYGSPLYIYFEDIIRTQCRQLLQAVTYPGFYINYSMKANSNIALLKIIRDEGLHVDVMSPGELYAASLAGFSGDEIFFVANNVDEQEFLYAAKKGVRISIDSLSQLETLGSVLPGSKVAVRINPGIGDGHHEKVITGGEKTKFGVHLSQLDDLQRIAQKYHLIINGLNMHIGSNFVQYKSYVDATEVLCNLAQNFNDLEFVDIGGGLGINYRDDRTNLNIAQMGDVLDVIFNDFSSKYGKKIRFFMEPGRIIVAESGIILTKVCARKQNPPTTYIGTDCGFNVLMRPMAYGSYHEIINSSSVKGDTETVTICGNICESGDILAENRDLTRTEVNDILVVLDAGAYGYSMASNYNHRLRPAEVLITAQGEIKLIRQRDGLNDLIKNQIID